jgi:hypothetical protein
MKSTVYTIDEMLARPDRGVPYTEKRDTTEIYKTPYYEETVGVAPAGAIISNIEEMSHWLIALMNDGKYRGEQVLPSNVLKATLEPAIALPNMLGEAKGFWELLNPAYGAGRQTASYRGRLLTFHGGDLDGFHSQVSFLPNERMGVIVFVIGDHCASLYNTVSYHVYERLLGMDLTPWSDRLLEMRKRGKQASTEARAKAGADRVPNTRPSHPLADYAGEYEHAAYGVLKIDLRDGQLQFDFHKLRFPLSHFHFERFDTPDDERHGKFSVNFGTNPQGDVGSAVMSLDEAEATFTRKPAALARELLKKLAGTYETPTGFKFQVVLKEDGSLALAMPGRPEDRLHPYKGLKFRIPQFSDELIEFVMEDGEVKALKRINPSGEYVNVRKNNP